MNPTLALPRAQAATIERAARAAQPLEYCAALLGTPEHDGHTVVVTHVVRLHNCDARPGRFAVDDADLRHARAVAHERGALVAALLHSHPTSPPTPSGHDLAAIAHAHHPWVIAAIPHAEGLQLGVFAARTGQALPLRMTP